MTSVNQQHIQLGTLFLTLKQEAQLLLGWPTVLPYSRRLCKSCIVHSCKSVQPFSRNVDDKEIGTVASRGLPELTQNVTRSSHSQSTPSLKISCKSVQPFCQDTKRHRRQTDRQTTDRRHAVPKARPIVRSAKNDTLSLSTFRRQLKRFYFSLY